jgi:hypothetical protein
MQKNALLLKVVKLLGVAALALFIPARVSAQSSARDALSIFPADTQQFAYSNLAQLRAQPDYQQIQSRLLTPQLKSFMDFMRSMGTDPDKDVDEVTLGWRGDLQDSSAYYGLAWGRFDPQAVHDYFVQQKLSWQEYGGYDLYAFGSGQARHDIFFTFFNYSQAAFGRLNDLQTMIDVRAGSKPALNTQADFVKYESELEGTSPQWGIATGAAAANRAAPWLAGGEKLPFDPQALLAPVHAVLYRLDWGGGFTAHMSVVCDSMQSASLLAQLVTAWQNVRGAPQSNVTPAVSNFIHGLQVEAHGSRVELTGSGPVQMVDQIMSGPSVPAKTSQ